MRMGNSLAAAFIVAVVGTIVPGCEGDEEPFGRICGSWVN
jgi:hypothetical protein